jgi:hypothetical protein
MIRLLAAILYLCVGMSAAKLTNHYFYRKYGNGKNGYGKARSDQEAAAVMTSRGMFITIFWPPIAAIALTILFFVMFFGGTWKLGRTMFVPPQLRAKAE